MSDEQHLFITPPTLFLPTTGLRISVLGIDDEWTDQLGDVLEAALPSIPMTFYHLDEPTAAEWQWEFHMMTHSNMIIVNVAKASDIEMMMAFSHINENKLWFYVDPDEVDDDIIALLNTLGANIFSTADELISIFRSHT